MKNEDWREYLKEERKRYKRFLPVKSIIFPNEEVYFNRYGFDHIVFKEGVPRPQDEVKLRFGLLKYVPSVLNRVTETEKVEIRVKKQSTAYFWTIRHRVGIDTYIRIILRRLNDGRIHFFSVMEE